MRESGRSLSCAPVSAWRPVCGVVLVGFEMTRMDATVHAGCCAAFVYACVRAAMTLSVPLLPHDASARDDVVRGPMTRGSGG